MSKPVGARALQIHALRRFAGQTLLQQLGKGGEVLVQGRRSRSTGPRPGIGTAEPAKARLEGHQRLDLLCMCPCRGGGQPTSYLPDRLGCAPCRKLPPKSQSLRAASSVVARKVAGAISSRIERLVLRLLRVRNARMVLKRASLKTYARLSTSPDRQAAP